MQWLPGKVIPLHFNCCLIKWDNEPTQLLQQISKEFFYGTFDNGKKDKITLEFFAKPVNKTV